MRNLLLAVAVLAALVVGTGQAAAQPVCEPSCEASLSSNAVDAEPLSALAPLLAASFAFLIAARRRR